MRLTFLAVALVAAGSLALTTSAATADTVKIEIRDGLVTLDAREASLREILREWARVGQTRIVNVEKVTGAPLTLQLTNVPEKQALEIVLRSVSGYMAAPRAVSRPDASLYDRILVLAHSTPPPVPATTGGRPGQQPSNPPFQPAFSTPATPAGPATQPMTPVVDDSDDDMPGMMPGATPNMTPGMTPFPGSFPSNPSQPGFGPQAIPGPAMTPGGKPFSPGTPQGTPPNPRNPWGIPAGVAPFPGAMTPAPGAPVKEAPTKPPVPER